MPPLKLLGTVLRLGRQRKGWSLEVVAQATGWSKPHLGSVERGEVKDPDTHLLMELSTLYGLKMDALRQAWALDQQEVDVDGERLWQMAYEQLSETARREIVCYAFMQDAGAELLGLPARETDGAEGA